MEGVSFAVFAGSNETPNETPNETLFKKKH
jgi:hypothetical protein